MRESNPSTRVLPRAAGCSTRRWSPINLNQSQSHFQSQSPIDFRGSKAQEGDVSTLCPVCVNYELFGRSFSTIYMYLIPTFLAGDGGNKTVTGRKKISTKKMIKLKLAVWAIFICEVDKGGSYSPQGLRAKDFNNELRVYGGGASSP